MRRTATAVAGATLAAHVLPAATWLPAVGRLVPGLTSVMEPGAVAVTFDDGPHPEGTPAVLDRLDELGWRATFFMLGSAVTRYPAVAREVAERGHTIGLHGYEHRYLLARAPRATWEDLVRAKDVVEGVTGNRPHWWRPPYGVLSAAGLAAARQLELRPLLWSAWGKDWRSDATPLGVASTVMRGRVNGGVVLLHDSDVTSAPGSWRTTVAALELLAGEVAEAGVRVAPLPRRLIT